jgi:hypothetical protein
MSEPELANTDKRTFYSQIVIRILAAGWILYGMGYQTVFERYKLQLDGVVVESHDIPSKGASRYETEYLIRDQAGHDQLYIAGPTDASLQRSLDVGTKIHKNYGDLGYSINESWVEFPTYFYSIVMVIAVALLVSGVLTYKKSRRTIKS